MPTTPTKRCRLHTKYHPDEPELRPLDDFGQHAQNPDGKRYECRRCLSAQGKAARAAKDRRLASDHETLRPGDLGDDYRAPNYDREKKQEYNEDMGRFGRELRDMRADPARLSEFLSLTAEQERRWMNKRLSRAQSLGAARELLLAREFEQIAERVRWPVQARGLAKHPKLSPSRRITTFVLSDLHFGAILPDFENPVGFDFLRAGRRLARLAHECAEFKTQYRDETHLNLGINGDVIEGMLGHNDMDNAPLAEQLVAAGHFLTKLIEFEAAHWNSVSVFFQAGNHGRNKLSHPGRATSSKWNSFESALYQFVARQCSRVLPNVSFDLPRAPLSLIPLFEHNAAMLHGDTELPLKAPSSSGGRASWNNALNLANAPKSHEPGALPRYGKPVHVLISGHFHDPDLFPLDRGWGVSQGALVPSNGHARTAGFSDRCMFWIFESTPRFPVGDVRPIRVSPADDADAGLDVIVPPFEWTETIKAA